MVCDKVVCVTSCAWQVVCDKVVCDKGGGREEEDGGVQIQKQEPHTILWGKVVFYLRILEKEIACFRLLIRGFGCVLLSNLIRPQFYLRFQIWENEVGSNLTSGVNSTQYYVESEWGRFWSVAEPSIFSKRKAAGNSTRASCRQLWPEPSILLWVWQLEILEDWWPRHQQDCRGERGEVCEFWAEGRCNCGAEEWGILFPQLGRNH